MDEAVLRAMQRWPNVPAVYGWLMLDLRGHWLIKTAEGRFERVGNPAMAEFFGRNFNRDDHGRWYVQNGPQQVFVSLEYTPWVYRLDGTASGLVAHTGAAAQELRSAFLDDREHLLFETDLGIGVVSDRDLPALLDRLSPAARPDMETTLQAVAAGETVRVRLFGHELPFGPIRAADVSRRFGFEPRPAPPAGQPDCA